MIGKRTVQRNVDIYALAGKSASINLYYSIVYKDGKVYFNDKECGDAIESETGMLKLNFKHLGIDNPMINAIILYKGTLEDTDYYKLDLIKKKYDIMYKEEKSKKEFEEKYLSQISTAKLKQKRRNDQLITLDDYEEIYIEEELKGSSNIFMIGGIVLLVTFGVYFVMSMKQAIQQDEIIKKK